MTFKLIVDVEVGGEDTVLFRHKVNYRVCRGDIKHILVYKHISFQSGAIPRLELVTYNFIVLLYLFEI